MKHFELKPRPWLNGRASAAYLAIALAHLAVALSPAHAFGKQSTANLQDQTITVEALPVAHFEKAHPDKTTFGKLEWRGGLVLSAATPFFGGWSGLTMDRDGSRLLAVSDSGVWMTGQLTYEGARPTGIAGVRIGALRGLDGRSFKRRGEIDAEGVALLQGTLSNGEVLVSFERDHRIVRYPVTSQGVGVPSAGLAMPADTRTLEPNKSLEAVCIVQAGREQGSIVTFAERNPAKDSHHVGWMRPPILGRGALKNAKNPPTWTALSLKAIDGYDLTDCAGLPNGYILVLERRYRVSYGDPLTGPRMRIRQLTQAELVSGGVMGGETLLDVGTGHEIDNMEGLAVHTDAKGTTVVTLISDDNFNAYLQRTILLQFALMERAPAATLPTAAAADK